MSSSPTSPTPSPERSHPATAATSTAEPRGWRRVTARVFPTTPDFFALLRAQSALGVATMTALVEYMDRAGGDDAAARRHASAIGDLEHEGDDLKERSMAALNAAFATPVDREDLYRAIITLDHVVNYAKTTVREMNLLGVAPDAHTTQMARLLLDGATALDAGYARLGQDTGAAEGDAQAARKAERAIEKVYRRALADLFDIEAALVELESAQERRGAAALRQVMEIFKRREIYRHLSNAGDRVAHAGEALHDIVVKTV